MHSFSKHSDYSHGRAFPSLFYLCFYFVASVTSLLQTIQKKEDFIFDLNDFTNNDFSHEHTNIISQFLWKAQGKQPRL